MQGCVSCCIVLHCDLLCVFCCVVLHYTSCVLSCIVLYFVLRVKFTWIKICYVFCCAVLQCVVLCFVLLFFCIALFCVVCYGQRRLCSRITPGNMGVPIGPILRYVPFQSIFHLYHKLALCDFGQKTILRKTILCHADSALQSPFGQFCI